MPKLLLRHHRLPLHRLQFRRPKTTSIQHVETRHRDPTFEKLMRHQKHLNRIYVIRSLLSSSSASVDLHFLSGLSQKLRLLPTALAYLTRFPNIFSFSRDRRHCLLTPTASAIFSEESAALKNYEPQSTAALLRILSMSTSRQVPLRAILKVRREIGLSDDFQDSILLSSKNPFALSPGNEPNTHILKLIPKSPQNFTPSVDNWREEVYRSQISDPESETRFAFPQKFPPCMKLSKDYRRKIKEWQELPYWGPYEKMEVRRDLKSSSIRMRKGWMKKSEKRAVGIVHEFLSLTAEKMVEVEKMSHFRKWFGIELNMRDLFLDHPGMFYLSTKGKVHTVFLREAYERGCLRVPNPVYEARRKLLRLLMMGRRRGGASAAGGGIRSVINGVDEEGRSSSFCREELGGRGEEGIVVGDGGGDFDSESD